MGKRIMIMAGGTGGHVFPALAVAQYLREHDWQVSWLGTKRGLEGKIVPEYEFDIDWLSVAGVRGKGLISKIKAIFLLIKACFQALNILRRRKPDVVLGMGGFVAGPGGLMARFLNIPVVIHEQNRVPGTTNRLLASFANQVLEAFPGSFSHKTDAKCTGNPLRKEFLSITGMQRSEPGQKIKLLVVGGSQGAKALNDVLPETAAALSELHIRHQTGASMCEEVKQRYEALGIEAEVLVFIEDMAAAYAWADLVICRAGAMTVSEVAAAGVPAIFIPFPHAIDDHQVANAQYLVDAGGAKLLLQKHLNPVSLAETVVKMMKCLATMGKAAKSCARLDATEMVAQACLEEAET